jgi:hypothetical protein
MHKLQSTAFAIFVTAVVGVTREAVPYPEGYRHWVHVKTGLIGPDSPMHATVGGFHHVYANAPALRGYETRRFPEGSVLVFDRLDVRTSGGATAEGPRLTVDVMVRDSTRFASTGGWGFERFRGDTRERIVADKASTACFSCHAGKRDQGFVFSDFRR